LADELMLDYAIHLHPKFRIHKYHEWLCTEIAAAGELNSSERSMVPPMLDGCVKRLIRKTKFPVGVTPHQPAHGPSEDVVKNRNGTVESSSVAKHMATFCNADCAIVFGTALESAADASSNNVQRYTCQSVVLVEDGDIERPPGIFLVPSEIPGSLETYAIAPLPCAKPFAASTQESWKSMDGWEVTLVNFMIPHADGQSDDNDEESRIYGVSLVFQRRNSHSATTDQSVIRLDGNSRDVQVTDSPVSIEQPANGEDPNGCTRTLRTTSNFPHFARHLADRMWLKQVQASMDDSDSTIAVGLALLSKRNVILAMRESLAVFLRELSRSGSGDASQSMSCCGALVDMLGTFSFPDVEPESLKCILEPFIRRGSGSWLEKPIGSQKDEFLKIAGHQLIRFLPPIPLALTFVSALLEQKIVFISSRRSILFSVISAMIELLQPLKWCHLQVPLVPSNLAPDLLQYPGPFILGLASEDNGVLELVRDLPEDVTLVDLDIGRVILAPSFAFDNEVGRNTDDTAQILRSQVLYLAQSFGSAIGAQLDSRAWCSDSPLTEVYSFLASDSSTTSFDRLRATCQTFVKELLAGTTSCCYWVDEAHSGSGSPQFSTVLFDEDRFFRIKAARHNHGFAPLFHSLQSTAEFALSPNDVDLVLELLLRCQSLNAYLGSLRADAMAFSFQ
jgi:DENN (AEX-3) domain